MTSSQQDVVATLLAAARHCYLEDGIAATGMKEVAVQAGVARSTLYRYFPGRDDLLVAVIKEEMIELNSFIHRKLARKTEPADFLVDGIVLALKEIPRRPLLKAVFASDEDSRARRVIWSSDAIVGFGEELMEHVISPAQEAGVLNDAVGPGVLVEWVYRLLLSFLTLPSNWIKSDAQLRATLRALLVPVLLQ